MVTGQGGDVSGDCARGDVGCDVTGGKRFCGAPLMDKGGFGGEGSATARRLTHGGRYGGNIAHLPDAKHRVGRGWDGPPTVDLLGGRSNSWWGVRYDGGIRGGICAGIFL